MRPVLGEFAPVRPRLRRVAALPASILERSGRWSVSRLPSPDTLPLAEQTSPNPLWSVGTLGSFGALLTSSQSCFGVVSRSAVKAICARMLTLQWTDLAGRG